MRFYVGTYTSTTSKGIHRATFDPATGAISEPELVAEITNPTFVAIHPSGKYLYAASEVDDFGGKTTGAVFAYAIDPATGGLTLLGKHDAGGTATCSVAFDPTAKTLLVANYTSGSVASFRIQPNGDLQRVSLIQHSGSSADAGRQEGPHAHCLFSDPSGKYALACDLGTDDVFVYQHDAATSKLTLNNPPSGKVAPGGGPRHLAFGKDGRFIYVNHEMGNQITVYKWDGATGSLTAVQTVDTIPADFKEETTTAEVIVDPSGRFVYTSNRGHDSIAIFAIDPTNGTLTPRGHTSTQGSTPRNFVVDPTDKYVIAANQESDSLVVFRKCPDTGALTPTGQTATVGKPVCVRFAPN